MDKTTAMERLRQVEAKQQAYGHAMSMLYYDGVTAAPAESAQGRGETLAFLSEESYRLDTAPETKETVAWLLEHRDELSPDELREVTEFNRGNEYVSSIPQEEYVAYTRLVNDAESVWHKAKEEDNFALFAPYLRQIVDTNRRFAGYYRPGKAPYDVLLDQYERGLTMAQADAFFAALRSRIVPLVQKIGQKPQVRDDFLFRHYPAEQQRIWSMTLMDIMKLDPARCAIGETEHPFTLNFSNHDVRITTHYYEDNVASSMYSVIHEGGHALYELGVDDRWQKTCLGGGVSMGIHESQSRLFENLVGRSRPFVEMLYPRMKACFPRRLADVTAAELYLAVNKSQPSLIRTEADELTYSLHVMVRYELEKALIDGSLAVEDLPTAWRQKMREYLNVEVPSDREGVLQDSHWSGGNIGYFPSYALGSAYGAQFISRMRRDVDVDGAMASGNLQPIVDWLTEKIYRHGSRYDPMELLEQVCGAPFDPSYYTDYLEKKFSEIYNL